MSTQIAPAEQAKKEETGIAKSGAGRKASDILAESLGLEPAKMIDVIKAQCFSGTAPEKVSNEMLAAFCVVANELGLNPLLPGMLYAYPNKSGGFTPMIGPDGVFKLLYQHPDVDSWEVEMIPDASGAVVAATATIYRKNNARPMKKTVYLSEWKVGSNPNWTNRVAHMLEIRALKQCARQIIHGLPSDPEEQGIIEAQVVKPAAVQQLPGETKSSATARAIATRQAPPEIVVPPASEPASTNSGTDPDGEPVETLFG